MGKGIDLARGAAPEHAALLDDLKDQLLIVFLKRLGGAQEAAARRADHDLARLPALTHRQVVS